jgi:hypothetical protein
MNQTTMRFVWSLGERSRWRAHANEIREHDYSSPCFAGPRCRPPGRSRGPRCVSPAYAAPRAIGEVVEPAYAARTRHLAAFIRSCAVRTLSQSSTRCTGAARSARRCCTPSTCLSSDGEDLRGLAIVDRKKRLARLLGGRRLGIVLSDHTDDDGATIFRHACRMGLEGIVSKRLSAPYRSGPSRDWLKVKNPDSPAMILAREAEW